MMNVEKIATVKAVKRYNMKPLVAIDDALFFDMFFAKFQISRQEEDN